MLEWLLNLDGNLLLFLQENVRNPVLTPLLRAITTLGNGGAVWIALAVLLLCIPRTRKVGCMVAAALLGTLLVNNIILKNLAARTRPYEVIEGLTYLVREPTDYSFPSEAARTLWCPGADPGDPDFFVAAVCGRALSERCVVWHVQRYFDQLWRGSDREPAVRQS